MNRTEVFDLFETDSPSADAVAEAIDSSVAVVMSDVMGHHINVSKFRSVITLTACSFSGRELATSIGHTYTEAAGSLCRRLWAESDKAERELDACDAANAVEAAR